MNPYDANFANTAARIGAWLRGMARRHRRPLLVIAAAGVTMAIGVAAADAPLRPAVNITAVAAR